MNYAKDSFKGRHVMVTGAGQGNGRAIAIGLARVGAHVIAVDVNEATLAETVDMIVAEAGAASRYVLDIRDQSACQRVAEKIAAATGNIDLLVNNAGILIRGGIDAEGAQQNWRNVMDVNVQGTFNVTYAFLPALKKTRGAIINIASIASFAGQAGALGYSPSKGAIKLFTQSLAAELAQDGVRVNAIAPGVIETEMSAVTRADPARLEKFMQRIPMGRVGKPEELLGPILFLASPLASYVTGVTLPVDGGFLAM